MVKFYAFQTTQNPKTPAAQRFSALRYSKIHDFPVAKRVKKLRYSKAYVIFAALNVLKKLSYREVKFTIAKLKPCQIHIN